MPKSNQSPHTKSVLGELLKAPPSEQGRRNPFWNLTDEQRQELEEVKKAYKAGELKHLTFSALWRYCQPMLDLKCCLSTFKNYMERE